MAKNPLEPSELWSLYPTPKVANTNPLVTTEERYRKIDTTERLQRRMLGRYGAHIGFYLALLVVVAITVGHLIWTLMTSIQPNDIGGAMFAVFTSFACAIATVLTSYLIYKKIDSIFTKHLFNGLPVIVLLVTINSVVAWSALTVTGHFMTGFGGFAAAMALTIAIAVVITIPLITMCASRVSAKMKVSILLVTVIALLALLLTIGCLATI